MHCVQDSSKPVLFSMARLDRVKNLSALVEWFARNERLRKVVNLVIVGGIVDPAQSNDHEEKEQCEKVGCHHVAGWASLWIRQFACLLGHVSSS